MGKFLHKAFHQGLVLLKADETIAPLADAIVIVTKSARTSRAVRSGGMSASISRRSRICSWVIKMPPTLFPVNSVKAMRGCIYLGPQMVPFARAVFEAYWGHDKDISQDAVLTGICQGIGVDPAKFLAGIGAQPVKDQLKANTDEVMARGGFGSPTIFLDRTDMYFGNDRLPLIREALQRRKASAA